jgi:RNA-dependent RNA polymerase
MRFIARSVDPDHRAFAFSLFDRYAEELERICVAHITSCRHSAMLTEEEVAVGTIVAKISQPRSRLDMSKLVVHTDLQVKGIKNALLPEEDGLKRG